MIEEGVLIGIMVILSRLTKPSCVDILNPLVKDCLGLIEDISTFDEEEEKELLNSGIVARLVSLL